MNAPEPIPFMTERGKSLESQILPLAQIKPCLSANHLVQGWLGAGGLSVLYGPSNSGKTFVAIDIATHIGCGKFWRGNRVKPGPVVYVAAEGGGGIRNRISAIKQAMSEMVSTTEFYLLPTHLDLHGSGDAVALCQALPTKAPALIVIDTLARSMGAGDENSARDVSQLIGNLDVIRERTGAHVLVVHHSGKNVDAGARGSSALRAAVDTEIAISDGQISCVKQRDMEIPQSLFFALETVELGNDADGDPVTSAIVVATDIPAKEAKPLSGRDEVAAQALTEALRLHGSLHAGEHFPVGRAVVSINHWREQCIANGLTDPDAKPDAQRKAFTRAKERLLDRDYARIWGGYVWKVSDYA